MAGRTESISYLAFYRKFANPCAGLLSDLCHVVGHISVFSSLSSDSWVPLGRTVVRSVNFSVCSLKKASVRGIFVPQH